MMVAEKRDNQRINPIHLAIVLTTATLVFGSWLTVSSYAWLSIGWFTVLAAAIALKRVGIIVWIPFAICVNWICFNYYSWATARDEYFVLVVLLIMVVVSIILFAVRRTFAKTGKRLAVGIVLDTTLNCMLGGLLVGLMLVAPIGLASIAVDFGAPWVVGVGYGELFLKLAIPLCILLGLVMGIPLGFVCDIWFSVRSRKTTRPALR